MGSNNALVSVSATVIPLSLPSSLSFSNNRPSCIDALTETEVLSISKTVLQGLVTENPAIM